jgi:hypothetical protein
MPTIEELNARLDEITAQRRERDSLDERWQEAGQALVDAERAAEAEQHDILQLANNVGPQLTAMKEELLAKTESYLDARDEYAALDQRYQALLRRARRAGIEADIPLIPAISADGAQINDQGWRIRKIAKRLLETPAW